MYQIVNHHEGLSNIPHLRIDMLPEKPDPALAGYIRYLVDYNAQSLKPRGVYPIYLIKHRAEFYLPELPVNNIQLAVRLIKEKYRVEIVNIMTPAAGMMETDADRIVMSTGKYAPTGWRNIDDLPVDELIELYKGLSDGHSFDGDMGIMIRRASVDLQYKFNLAGFKPWYHVYSF